MDVLSHIKKEHESFKSLIESIKNSSGEKKKSMFRELHTKLYGHHEAEEHLLFPRVQAKAKEVDKEIVLEMIEEHSLGRHQLSLLERTSADNETWDAKFSVLSEVLDHHMQEEENEFFELARQTITGEALKQMLDPFEKLHEEKQQEKANELK